MFRKYQPETLHSYAKLHKFFRRLILCRIFDEVLFATCLLAYSMATLEADAADVDYYGYTIEQTIGHSITWP